MAMIYKEDLEHVAGSSSSSVVTIASNDISDSAKLLECVQKYVTDSKTDLTGAGFDASRTYFDKIYLYILNMRKEISERLSESAQYVSKEMINYMGEYDFLDDSKIAELESLKRDLDSKIFDLISEELPRQINEEFVPNPVIQEYIIQLEETKKHLEKLKYLNDTDDDVDADLYELRGKIDSYSNYIDAMSILKNEIIIQNPSLDPNVNPGDFGGGDDYGGSGGSSGDDSGCPGGTCPVEGETGEGTVGGELEENPFIPTTPVESEEPILSTEESVQAALILAASLIGKTSAQLAADTQNGVYNIDNYSVGEEWDATFVNDVIRREENLTSLLDGYYNNSAEYPNPINSSSDMLNYAMDGESNIEYNWSNGSIDTITSFNEKNNFDPVNYEEYTPKEGDIIFLDSEETNGTFNGNTKDMSSVDRVGFVESVNVIENPDGTKTTTVTVIEGNYGENADTSKVTRTVYDIDSKKILGYGTIKEYSPQTDTSNNHNGSQNGIVDPKPIEVETPNPSNEGGIYVKEGDTVGQESGGTIDSEGVRRDPNETVIDEVKLEELNEETNIIEEEQIPTDEIVEIPEEKEEIDMSNNEDGEYYDNIDPNIINWDWEKVDE